MGIGNDVDVDPVDRGFVIALARMAEQYAADASGADALLRVAKAVGEDINPARREAIERSVRAVVRAWIAPHVGTLFVGQAPDSIIRSLERAQWTAVTVVMRAAGFDGEQSDNPFEDA